MHQRCATCNEERIDYELVGGVCDDCADRFVTRRDRVLRFVVSVVATLFALILLSLAGLEAFGQDVSLPPVFRSIPDDVRAKALPYHLGDTDMARHWQFTGAGEGILVGVVDTGIDWTHPEFNVAGKIKAAQSFLPRARDFYDRNGHGTHVASTIAGLTVGMAPKARLVIAQVLGANGSGSNASVAAGIRWLADQGCTIINISLGGPTDDAATREAVKYAKSKGCLVFCANGNESAAVVGFPAQHCVGVGAVNRQMVLADFSNYGVDNDIVGYGVRIYAGVPGGHFAEFSGTSMACPFIAGVAANRQSAELRHLGRITTNSDAELLKLETMVTDLGPAGRDPAYGRGFPDLDRCLYEGLVKSPTDPNTPTSRNLPDRVLLQYGVEDYEYMLAP